MTDLDEALDLLDARLIRARRMLDGESRHQIAQRWADVDTNRRTVGLATYAAYVTEFEVALAACDWCDEPATHVLPTIASDRGGRSITAAPRPTISQACKAHAEEAAPTPEESIMVLMPEGGAASIDDLPVALLIDDVAESMGMHGDRRRTCHRCQSWVDHAHDRITNERLTLDEYRARWDADHRSPLEG